MYFRKIDNNYRPIPFWSWNERLNTAETRRQVKVMKDAGIGGYFMHARGGLLTEYMSDEWFDNIDAACDEGITLGMRNFAYDENGWPSGFADGKVLSLGEDYHLKSIVYKKSEDYTGDTEHILLVEDGITYYYEANPLYVDLLSPDVTDAFIENVHEVYRKRCGDKIEGFFTDEPQLLRAPGFPYSVITLDEFKSRYGYDLVPNLPALFFDRENTARVRFDFWRMTTDLFSKNFFKRIYDWCNKYGYKLTGHLVCEDTMEGILMSNGSAMPHYEYMHIPGMDWLGRPIGDFLTATQLGSVAAQIGQKQVLSETFAMTGHNVSHAELKRIYEWQMVRGVNLLCPHLEGYSNRGIRKRDYPTAMYYQQPWWEDADIFFDTVSRIGMILGEGRETPDTLLIHSMSSAWCLYDGMVEGRRGFDAVKEFSRDFVKYMRKLEDKHILYHLGDEMIMERHGRVENGELVIGNMRYKRVVLPTHTILFENTKRLLDEFVGEGGEIVDIDDIAPNPIIKPCRVTYTKRTYEDFVVHYFVNSENEEITLDIAEGNLILDPVSGDVSPFSGSYTFAPYESLILIDNGEARVKVTKIEEKPLSLLGEWSVRNASYNSITLDRCDYYFDGELIERDGYVLDILPRLNELRRPVKLYQKYRFMIEELPLGDVFLATETPEIFDIKVNGKPLVKRDVGDFRDISFRRLPITEHLTLGENIIELNSEICQGEGAFRHLENSWVFETMSNCLSYDIEIEPIYIVGDFGVKITAPITELNKDAYRVKELLIEGSHSFAITRAPKRIIAEELDFSGYPQFAGSITLTRKFNVEDTALYITPIARGANAIRVRVNGKDVGIKMFAPYNISLAEYLKVGENEIEITIINNLRNMQGPSHLKEGESYFAGRNAFYRESNVFNHARGVAESCHDVLPIWCDDLCLVHFGIVEGRYILTENQSSPW